jgi:TolA-binding protein
VTLSVFRHLLAIGMALAVGGTASAQDRVILKRPGYAGRMTITGTIEEYTGTAISVRSSQGDTVRPYPAEEVVGFETPQTDSHDRGLALLAEGKVDEAIREFDAAIRKEPRAWVRREILALLVRCSLRRGDYPAAGTRFLTLVKSDPTTRHFRLIPLVWADEPIPAAAKSQGHAWLAGTVEVGRLMGASLLLEDPAHAIEARSTLRQLSSSTDRRIQSLAQMQTWRHESADGVSELEIFHWGQRIDELSPDLRAGPRYVLGRAYAARHDYEMAATTLLWLPLVDDHDFRLTARACLEAGVALGKIGQQSEAQGLFREVTQRFAETPFADEAQKLLKAAAEKEEPSANPRLK